MEKVDSGLSLKSNGPPPPQRKVIQSPLKKFKIKIPGLVPVDYELIIYNQESLMPVAKSCSTGDSHEAWYPPG